MRIGWKELVDLPQWGIRELKAKIDTGARSCALHAVLIEPLHEGADRGGDPKRLRLALSPWRRAPEELVWIEVPVTRYKTVKNSGGQLERRPFVRTRIRLGNREIEAEIGITNRARMLFRIILGRKFLERRFMVDVAAKYLHGRPEPRKRP